MCIYCESFYVFTTALMFVCLCVCVSASVCMLAIVTVAIRYAIRTKLSSLVLLCVCLLAICCVARHRFAVFVFRSLTAHVAVMAVT